MVVEKLNSIFIVPTAKIERKSDKFSLWPQLGLGNKISLIEIKRENINYQYLKIVQFLIFICVQFINLNIMLVSNFN